MIYFFKLGLHNNLILFDRGYPSKEFIATLIENNIKFLMRVSKSFTKEVNNVRGEDNIISYRYNGKSYSIRVIKFALNETTEEILVTTIFDKSFNVDDFKNLYFKRWGVILISAL